MTQTWLPASKILLRQPEQVVHNEAMMPEQCKKEQVIMSMSRSSQCLLRSRPGPLSLSLFSLLPSPFPLAPSTSLLTVLLIFIVRFFRLKFSC